MGERHGDAFRVGRDVVRYGQGGKLPEKKPSLSRRGALMVGGTLLAAAVAGGTLAEHNKATNPDVWRDLVGRENPHPEYGHLIWSTMIVPKEGAKLRSHPTEDYHEDASWPFTTSVDRDPVIRRIHETMLIKNPVILARGAADNSENAPTVNPVGGQPYRIEPESIWFAIGVPLSDSPARVAFLKKDDVNFVSLGADGKPHILGRSPYESIIQAPIPGRTPWEGTAHIGGVPLQIGLVAR